MQKLWTHIKENKVLWLSGAGIVLTMIALVIVILVMAGGKDDTPKGDDPSVTDPSEAPILSIAESDLYELKVDEKNKSYHLTVGNGTTALYLYQHVQVREGAQWLLSTKIEATTETTIASKTVGPEAGENTYYILCTDEDGLFEIYTVTVYRKHLYTVTFESLSEEMKIEEGGMAALPEGKPQKAGYTFVSWNFNFTTPITEDVQVSANWKANTYTITYDPNGGSLTTQTQTVTFGTEVKLAVPSRSGYDFVGWQRGETTFADGIWDTAEDVKLTAIWDYSAFTVMLDAAGGTLENESVKVRYGVTYSLPVPTREGYVFGGWYNGEELLDNEGVWSRLTGLTLVARWSLSESESIYCTMIPNGGSIVPQTQQLPVGATLPIPQRSGYTFGGWFIDDTLTIEVESVTQELIDQYGSSIRLYAWWTEEGKPGEFVYELSGVYCVVIGYTSSSAPYPTIPEYIGGRQVQINIKPPANPDAGITVSPQLNLTVGDASVIFATFIPAYIEDSTKLYFSTTSDCIVLGEDGSFTALKPGVAVVNIRNEDGKYTATCTLNIVGKPNANPGITVPNPEITLEESKEVHAGVMFTPDRQGDSTDLVYTVDGDCVKVENGVIIALKPGTATITVKNLDGKYQAEIKVTVIARIADPNAGITIENTQINVTVGQSGKINATVIPAFPEDSVELHFATDSDCIALNADGSFTALKAGVATVSVSTTAGLTANVQITVSRVENENPGITPDSPTISLEEGEGGQINAVVVPKYEGDSEELIYTTDSDCIELHEDGSFVAKKEGTAVVTLTTADGLSATVTVTVTAKPDPTPNENPGLTLISAPAATITVGKTIVLQYSFIPDFDGDDLTVSVSADVNDVVQVIVGGGNVTVKGMSAGQVVLTLSAADGKYTAKATITVTEAVDETV